MSSHLKIGIEVVVLTGLLLVWTGIVTYHATFIWPVNIPGSLDESRTVPLVIFSSALRLAPLYGASLVLFASGTSVAFVGAVVGLVMVKPKDKYMHAWVGLLGGACVSISAWFLLGIETSSAWYNVEKAIHEKSSETIELKQVYEYLTELSAPLVSYSVLVILSAAIISRNLLSIDVGEYFGILDTRSSVWIVKSLVMISMFFFQTYYPIMLMGGNMVGLVCLGFVPVFLLTAYAIGHGLAYHSKKIKNGVYAQLDDTQEPLLQP